MNDTLHIYGQFAQHSNVYIAGDRISLIRLREAINLALDNDVEEMEFFTNDGEGYSVVVSCLSEDKMDTLGVPYTWEHVQDNRVVFPWNLTP